MRLLATAFVAALAAAPVQAELRNATGCPAGAWTDYSRPGGVSISWSFTNIGPVVAFHPGRMVYGGGVAPLNPAQVQAWAPALDNLRAAAASGHPVTVYWDDSSNTVTTLIVRWNQRC